MLTSTNFSKSILKHQIDIAKNSIQMVQFVTSANERADFLVYYYDNEVHIRHVAAEFQQQESMNSNERVVTPLATKDFVVKFYESDGSKTVVRQVQTSRLQGSKPDSLIVLASSIDSFIFKLPLRFFYVQLQNKKLSRMEFAIKRNEQSTVTRNFDKFRKIALLCPINSDYLVGYDHDRQSINLLYYADLQAQIIRLKHSAQQYSLIHEPSAIYIDTRGVSTQQIVSKNQIYLLYERIACIDIFEYFYATGRRQALDIKESEAVQVVTSRYNYYRQLYPLNLLPDGYKPEVNKLISCSTVLCADQFLLVICMAWKLGDAQQQAQNTSIQTNSQMISHVKSDVFLQNNVFVYNNKKMLAAYATDFMIDLIAKSPDEKTLFVANSTTGTTQQLQVSSNGKIEKMQEYCFMQPIKSITCGKHHNCILTGENGLICFKTFQKISQPVSVLCQQHFDKLILPRMAERSVKGNEKSVKFNQTQIKNDSVANMDYANNKSIYETEILERLKRTRIPGVGDKESLASSLFSPASERMLRKKYLMKQVQPDGTAPGQYAGNSPEENVRTLKELASKMSDTTLNVKEIEPIIEHFAVYYQVYDKLRLVEEFVMLLLDPTIPDDQIQKIPQEMKELFTEHLADCAITITNARFVIGYREFYHQEMKYVNTKLKQILTPLECDFSLDFYQINMIDKFCNSKCLNSQFLIRFHEMLEKEIQGVRFDGTDIIQILYQEFKDQGGDSVMGLVSNKTQQMGEHFRQVCLYKTKVLSALQYAATQKQVGYADSQGVSSPELKIVSPPKYLSGEVQIISDILKSGDAEINKSLQQLDIDNFHKTPDNIQLLLTQLSDKVDKYYSLPDFSKLNDAKQIKPAGTSFSKQIQQQNNQAESYIQKAQQLRQSINQMQKSMKGQLNDSMPSQGNLQVQNTSQQFTNNSYEKYMRENQQPHGDEPQGRNKRQNVLKSDIIDSAAVQAQKAPAQSRTVEQGREPSESESYIYEEVTDTNESTAENVPTQGPQRQSINRNGVEATKQLIQNTQGLSPITSTQGDKEHQIGQDIHQSDGQSTTNDEYDYVEEEYYSYSATQEDDVPATEHRTQKQAQKHHNNTQPKHTRQLQQKEQVASAQNLNQQYDTNAVAQQGYTTSNTHNDAERYAAAAEGSATGTSKHGLTLPDPSGQYNGAGETAHAQAAIASAVTSQQCAQKSLPNDQQAVKAVCDDGKLQNATNSKPGIDSTEEEGAATMLECKERFITEHNLPQELCYTEEFNKELEQLVRNDKELKQLQQMRELGASWTPRDEVAFTRLKNTVEEGIARLRKPLEQTKYGNRGRNPSEDTEHPLLGPHSTGSAPAENKLSEETASIQRSTQLEQAKSSTDHSTSALAARTDAVPPHNRRSDVRTVQPFGAPASSILMDAGGTMWEQDGHTSNPFRAAHYAWQGGHNRDRGHNLSHTSLASDNSYINTSFYRENINKASINSERVSRQLQNMETDDLRRCFDQMSYSRQTLLKVGYRLQQSTFRRDMMSLPKQPRTQFIRELIEQSNNQQLQVQQMRQSLADTRQAQRLRK